MRYTKNNRALVLTIILVLSILLSPSFSLNKSGDINNSELKILDDDPPYINNATSWADSLLNKMSLQEKVGQLFMVAAYSNRGKKHINKIIDLIKKYHIGGLIFFQGTPRNQVQLTNSYQSLTKTPLLIAMDAEWGVGMRLDSVFDFPRQLNLGAIRDNNLIYQMGVAISEQCKRLGVHVNFAPVADVNSNPMNPVINDRSFGEDIYNVANKSIAYMRGMQDNNVLACAKHFPGHGDTDKDSHKTLPSVSQSKQRIDSLELYPFRQLIKNGVGSIMSAHLYVPALDSLEKRASSLSKKIITELLKDEMDFNGLVFTDALNMKGVSQYFKPGVLEVKALLAGNDVLLYSEDVPRAIKHIEKAITKGTISINDINNKVLKILKLKEWAGLKKINKINTEGVNEDLNKVEYKVLDYKLRESALTVSSNYKDFLPIKSTNRMKLATLSIGSESTNTFQKTIDLYKASDHFYINKSASPEDYRLLLTKLKRYSHVIVSFHKMSRYMRKDYGISFSSLGFLKKLQSYTNVVVALFGSPYSLTYFNDATNIIVAYEDTESSQTMTAQALFGGIKTHGRLPVTASYIYPVNKGIISFPPNRLKYTFPEYVNMSSQHLEKIDSIALDAISDKVTPGCQIFVSRHGNTIYHKSFGYHTYDKKAEVEKENIYDIASITKIASTTLALMKLYDQKKISLDSSIQTYLSEFKGTNKGKLKLKDILIHESGLKSWIPFYLSALELGFDSLFKYQQNDTFCIRTANNLYMNKVYKDTIWKMITESEVKEEPKYTYSDLGYYFFQKIVERITGKGIDAYLKQNFYDRMDLKNTCFNPILNKDKNNIIPTEHDKVFRKQVIHGYVHDPGAAMFGGVAGHAGLFSNAKELAIIGQMLLNGGEYGGEKFIKSATIEKFTAKQKSGSRRGLGFDKPSLKSDKGPTSGFASYKTFGHTGFTGTCIWVDPKYDLIYVFLSNRVHPSASPNKLANNNIRTKIQDVIYESIQN